MRTRTLLTTLLVAPLLAACGAADGTADAGADGVRDVLDGCPQMQVVGLRGQSQSLDHHRGLGTEVDAVVTAVERGLAERGTDDVEVDAIRHRSRDAATLDTYEEDVAEGTSLLVDRLVEVRRDCPDARVVVVGFSQGAQVAHQTLAEQLDLAAEVDVLALLGSPRHDPDAPVRHLDLAGPTPTSTGSLGAGPDLGELAGRTVDACLAGDVVCAADGGSDLTVHKRGYEDADVTRAVADAVLDLLG